MLLICGVLKLHYPDPFPKGLQGFYPASLIMCQKVAALLVIGGGMETNPLRCLVVVCLQRGDMRVGVVH